MSSCPHFSREQIPTCLALNSSVFKNAQSFLSGSPAIRTIETPFPLIIRGCMGRDVANNAVKTNTSNCIGCGFCIAGCPSRSFEVPRSMQPISQCGSGLSASSEAIKMLKTENTTNRVFPKLVKVIGNQKSSESVSFANFTGSDEVRNLSPWAAQMARYVCGSESEVALEVSIDIEGKPRAGRLDVCVRSENGVFIFESKKTFKSMIIENRVFDQFLDYRIELDAITQSISSASKCHLFILIGGEETDVFPMGNPECTSFDRESTRFLYNWLKTNNGKIVTAQGLLWLAWRDLTDQSPRSFEILKRFDLNETARVLTSRGFVNNEQEIESLELA